ncbi:MAG: hypothetical protein R3272_09630, partial [Candidatus Promineifilaceae bacterium]|nr:hypothetical protein [Candidatus Promineifilaceae bacterium]
MRKSLSLLALSFIVLLLLAAPGRAVEPGSAAAPAAAASFEPLGELLLPSGSTTSVRAVAAGGDYAYLLTRGGVLHTYDISAAGANFTLEEPVHTLDVGLGAGVLRHGNFLYVYGNGGAQVLSLADPAAPTIGNQFADVDMVNMVRSDQILLGVGRGHVTLYDVSNPNGVVPLTGATLGDGNTGFSVALLGDATAPGAATIVVGQFASGAGGTNGLALFDLLAPANLAPVGTIPGGVPYHLHPFRDLLVACQSSVVELWDFENPHEAEPLTSFQTGARVCARDNDRIITNGTVLQLPGLEQVASFTPGGSQIDGFPYGSAVEGPFIFLAQSQRVLILSRPQPLPVRPVSGEPPRIDGEISIGEWPQQPLLEFEHGLLAARNDGTHLYLLLDLLADSQADPTGADSFNISVDVDRDGQVTPGVDLNYFLDPQSGNLQRRLYDVEGYQSPMPALRSSKSRDFNCNLWDGTLNLSAGPVRLSCSRHVVWEVAISLADINARPGEPIYIGFGVVSQEPQFAEAVPANYERDFANLLRLDLSDLVPVLEPDDGPPVPFAGNPIEVTQAVQTPENSLPLVDGKTTVARVYLNNTSGAPADLTVYLYGTRGGADLPGSPLTAAFTAPTSVDRTQLDDTANFQLPDSWTSGNVTLSARAARWLGAETTSGNVNVNFQVRQEPVYWVIPVNEGSASSPTLPDADDIDDHESFLEAVYPVAEVSFVRKPWTALGANQQPGELLIAELNEYYGGVVLAWIFGLLFTGESPFDLPHQIYGFTPTRAGSSDPLWKSNGPGMGYVAYGGDWDFSPSAPEEDDYTMAHELNHNLDRSSDGTWGRHNGGCQSRGPDPEWPYDDDDINEIGFDTRAPWVNGVVSDRRTVLTVDYPDFMSYCQHP